MMDFSKLLKHSWLIVLAMIIGGTAASLYANWQPTIYQVQARLLVGPGIDSPRPDLDVLRASGQLIQTYAEIPLTEPFLQEIIDELKLDMEPSDLAKIIRIRPNPETQILTIVVQDVNAKQAHDITYLIAEKLVQLSPSNPNSPANLVKGQIQSQVAELEQSVARTKNTLFQMEADYRKAVDDDRRLSESAGSIEAISKQLDQFEQNSELIASATSQREAGIDFLEELALNTTARIAQFEYELGQTNNPITDQIISEQIRLERNHLSEIRQTIAEIDTLVEGVPLDRYITTTQQQVNDLEEEARGILYNYDLRRLQFDQISQLQDRLSNARAIEASRQVKILTQIARERERISDVRLSRIENQRLILEQITQERSRLADMQDTLALMYSSIQTADPNQVKIIELASPITMTISTSLIILIGVFAGAVLAAVGVLWGIYSSKNIETSDQVSWRVEAPIIDVEKEVSPFDWFFNRKRVRRIHQEMYHLLGVRLLYSQTDEDRKLIIIGATDKQVDTGIAAATVAGFLAQSGKQVMLIDANVDKPSISKFFTLAQQEGLSDYLTETTKSKPKLASIEQHPSLKVIPFGTEHKGMTVMNTTRLIPQLNQYKEQFDTVLISVPALIRPDALALASAASNVILVVAKGKTKQHRLEEVIENLRLVEARILSVLLKSPSPAGEPQSESGFQDALLSAFKAAIVHLAGLLKNLQVKITAMKHAQGQKAARQSERTPQD